MSFHGMRFKRPTLLPFLFASLISCGESLTEADPDLCAPAALPLSGPANSPTITDVGLEVTSDGIILVATASDPQGSANVQDVEQAIGVFPNARCDGQPIVLRDDLAYVDIEETFGPVVTASSNAPLFNAIADATTWPVQVEFADIDGNKTLGQVRARIIH
jgi:hypothetical protein